MNVYVLIGGWTYEGFDILGIYATEKLAKQYEGEALKTQRYQYVEIQEMEVINKV